MRRRARQSSPLKKGWRWIRRAPMRAEGERHSSEATSEPAAAETVLSSGIMKSAFLMFLMITCRARTRGERACCVRLAS